MPRPAVFLESGAATRGFRLGLTLNRGTTLGPLSLSPATNSASELPLGSRAARWLYRRVPALGSLRDYDARTLRCDFFAGLTVASVAVPQAMAYAVAAGIPPRYGLYTAIVMTAVGALFTSSKQLINGPTNVISIAVLSALAPIPPEQKLACVMALAFLVGAFQTLITLLRLGDLTRYVSHSVVVGFTAGASLLLLIDQSRNLFGWAAAGSPHDHFLVRTWDTWIAGGAPNVPTMLIGAGAILFIVALRWLKRKLGWILFPELLLAVVLSGVLVGVFRLDEAGVAVVGAIPRALPSFAVPEFPQQHMRVLSESALAIATLGLLEALAMAKHLANQTGQKLDLNQQCLSEGLANLSGSFFQCIPGSGSLTRSAINHQAGAVSEWSGVWSAAAVALITVAFAPYASYIPRAALAGILMVTAFGMIDWKAFGFHVRATRYDAAIVFATASAAVFISVEFCILIGVLASFVLAVPRAGRMTRTEFVVHEDGVVRARKESEPVDDRMLIFGLEGELFFGSGLALEEHLGYFEARAREAEARVIVLRVKRLRNPDAVGMHEILRWIAGQRAEGRRVILAGVRAELLAALKASGAIRALGENQVFTERKTRGSSTVEAVRAAYGYLTRNYPEQASPESIPPLLADFQV